MEESASEASINVIQALSRAMEVHKPLVMRRLERYKHDVHRRGVEPKEGSKKLAGITAKAHEILFKANSVFPFNLFPDTVTIDREKVTVVNRFFFRVAKINSTPIQDIQSVEADVGPFFGTVKMTSKYFLNNPREVTFLWREDAMRIQHLIQGYVIAYEREIDCSEMGKERLISVLEDLGSGNTD